MVVLFLFCSFFGPLFFERKRCNKSYARGENVKEGEGKGGAGRVMLSTSQSSLPSHVPRSLPGEDD